MDPSEQLPSRHDREAQAMVRAFGWATCFVDGDPPFAYTLGLQDRFGHPELLVCGMKRPFAEAFIDRLVEELARGRALRDQRRVRVLGHDMPILASLLDAETVARACPSLATHRAQVDDDVAPAVLHVFWPDAHGRLPGESACSPDVVDDQRLANRL